ncbi:MAG: urease accessory protein UreD [Bacteroidota bacterium]
MKATLNIHAGLRQKSTILKSVFATTPYKLANITEDKQGQVLELMIMSNSPGILDGDQHAVQVELEAGTNIRLHTQSYQRLFNMQKSASLSFSVNMAANSSFFYLPHPTVPHKASSFSITNNIRLAENCTLVFGEIITCGRKLNGEVFSFTKYTCQTQIFLHEKLVIKENLRLEPAAVNIYAVGQLEGFTHQATLIYLRERSNIPALILQISELLLHEKGIVFGISEAPVSGLVCRFLGLKAEQLHDCLKRIGEFLFQIQGVKTDIYA